MKSKSLSLVLGALIILAAPALHAQSDIYTSTFIAFDPERWEIHGYSAAIATYDVQFYYGVVAVATLSPEDGKNLDVSSVNSSDDEYTIAEVGIHPAPIGLMYIGSCHGVTPYYYKPRLQPYDAFNFQYRLPGGGTMAPYIRRNYIHFIGRGPAHYIKKNENELNRCGDAEKAAPGSLAIEVQEGKSWMGGGSVVLDKLPTTLTKLTAEGMTGPGKFRWTVGPKLKLVGSARRSEILVCGTGLSDTNGDTSVSLSFVSRTGKKQTASIAFTVRKPTSLTRLGIIPEK
jgi:hypothetical protein